MHSYKLPGLSRYVFNEEGECRSVEGTCERKKKARVGMWSHGRYYPCEPKYMLVNDEGNHEQVTVKEILQYIKHIKLFRSLLTCDTTSLG